MTVDEGDKEHEVRGPSVAHGIEKRILALTFWQTILSVAAVGTGLIALYAALTESQAVRKQTAASVWPYVQLMVNDTSDGTSASFALSLDNVGVGPARMRSVKLTLQGRPMRTWQSVAEALSEDGAVLGTTYGKNSISGRVLAPQQSVVAVQTNDRQLALKLQDAVYGGGFTLAYCYCSIFNDCWNKPATRTGGSQEIQSVPRCPDYGEASFLD